MRVVLRDSACREWPGHRHSRRAGLRSVGGLRTCSSDGRCAGRSESNHPPRPRRSAIPGGRRGTGYRAAPETTRRPPGDHPDEPSHHPWAPPTDSTEWGRLHPADEKSRRGQWATGQSLVTCLLQQVQVPAGLTPAEFVIQRRFLFRGPATHEKSERRVTASGADRRSGGSRPD